MKSFKVDQFLLDDDQPPLFLPEIGTFFNHDHDLAKTLVTQIRDAGAEIVKGEVLHDPDVVLDDDTPESYLSKSGERVTERNRDLIERKVISLGRYEELFRYCRQTGLGLVLSVYDFKGAEFAHQTEQQPGFADGVEIVLLVFVEGMAGEDETLVEVGVIAQAIVLAQALAVIELEAESPADAGDAGHLQAEEIVAPLLFGLDPVEDNLVAKGAAAVIG
jgi:sialic acid synthase SpsE